MSLTAGTRLGPYEILALLGTGGMGEVWQARDTRLNRIVAVKQLKAQHNDRFEQEARAIAALNHPHICQIHDIGPDYLVLEYIEGQPLRGAFPAAEALRLAIQIASALEEAHAKGILHRDLKPANIMLTGKGVAKLLDFGLAKLVSDEIDVTQTMPGTVLGTMAYMSPEQAQGKPLDQRTDVFSFGAVLYEMLSGSRAFNGDSTAEVLGAVLRDDPRPIQAPPALERIVRRCLQKSPGQRFQTMGELRGALEHTTTDVASPGPLVRGSAPWIEERGASIAVLPFTDMSAAKDQEWFCDGIAEEILNALTPLKGLRVAARTSAFSFKGKGDDLRTIGEKLNVTTVLEGSVRRAGDRLRITVQLSDVQNGFQLWSERYDRELKDIFDTQDEIAKAIAERLRVTLAGGKDDRLVERATTNVEAYQRYLKGRALLSRRGASIPAALDSFRKAVELDPGYSTGLGWHRRRVHRHGDTRVPWQALSQNHMRWRQRARSIELDPTSSARPHRAGVCDLAVREQSRDGEAGVRASAGAQPELPAGSLLVRDLLFAMGLRGVRAGHRGGPPRARRRSAVLVRHR